MNDIIKICKTHGELTKEQVMKSGTTPKGTIQFRCKECNKVAQRKHRDNDPEAFLVWQRNYQKDNYDSKLRWNRLKSVFGVNKEQYDAMLTSQNHVCAICKEPETLKSKIGRRRHEFLCIDHCHDTGKIRGLLCRKCNGSLGGFKDSISMLESAIKYLELFI